MLVGHDRARGEAAVAAVKRRSGSGAIALKGADTIVYLAASPEVEGLTGS